MTKQQYERAVLHWAKAWWLGLRPRGWTEAQHLKEPTRGLQFRRMEQHLARAVAAMVQAEREAEE